MAAMRINSSCRLVKLPCLSKSQRWVSKERARKPPAIGCWPSTVGDSDSPPGRVTVILSTASSAVTSSASGCNTTPCVDGSARSSTKFCPLRKPRAGPSAVITISRSPMSRSASTCSLRGWAKGMAMLARFLPMILRAMVSGRLGVEIGVGQSDDPARAVGVEADEARQFQPQAHDRLAVGAALEHGGADDAAAVVLERGEIDLGGAVEHQPQRVGALEHGGRRLRHEGKFGAQGIAGAVQLDDDRRVGARRRTLVLVHGRFCRRRRRRRSVGRFHRRRCRGFNRRHGGFEFRCRHGRGFLDRHRLRRFDRRHAGRCGFGGGVRLCRGFRRGRRRVVMADVDHDAAVLAEGAHIRRANEREGDGDRIVSRHRTRSISASSASPALASARSHRIGWSNSSVRLPSPRSGTTLAISGMAKT